MGPVFFFFSGLLYFFLIFFFILGRGCGYEGMQHTMFWSDHVGRPLCV